MAQKKFDLATSIQKFDYAWSISIAFGIGLLITFTGVWQLCVIAGFVSGLFIKRRAGLAWWMGFLGVMLAWMVILGYFLITQPAMALVDLIIEFIIGTSGLGIIGLAITLMIGALLGGTGGFLGHATIKLATGFKQGE
ncbi:MAG: hypothetical protein ACTSUE_09730 [Promethearchaeota archaeon]